MKRIAAFALAAMLMFGGAVPAFAVGPHHRMGQCFDYTGLCHRMAQDVITPGLQSLNGHLCNMLSMCAYPLSQNAQSANANGGQQVDTYATSPSLCANGACARYLDANQDGICDYHGADCPNLGGVSRGNGAGNNAAGAASASSPDSASAGSTDSGSAAGSGSYYGRHHNSGHHGGWHH